jgi:hypothetical protein
MVSATSEKLSLESSERKRRDELVSIVLENAKVYRSSTIAMGRALSVIVGEKLYRETHPTFESFCSEVFGFSRSRAYMLIADFNEAERLSTYVDKCPEAKLIATDLQRRETKRVPDDKLEEVLTKALEMSGGGEIKPITIVKARESVLFCNQTKNQEDGMKAVAVDSFQQAVDKIPKLVEKLRECLAIMDAADKFDSNLDAIIKFVS